MRKKKQDNQLDILMHKVVSVPIPKLNPSKYNPRKISQKEFNKLKRSIREYGFVEPIVIQKKGYNIIAGHQRVKGIIDICKEDGFSLPEIPTVILDINTRKAKLLNIGLNKIGGEFKQDMLANLIKDLNDDQEFGSNEIESMGYEIKEVEKILAEADNMVDDESSDLTPFATSITLSLKFDTVEERDTVKAILAEKASKGNLKPGTVLHRLLVKQDKKWFQETL